MNRNIDINYIKNEFKKIQNYFISQRYDKVIEKTLILLKKDPYQAVFYNYIGLSYRQLGQLENSELILSKGIKLFPKNFHIICNLGSLYRYMSKYDKAEFYLKKGLEIKPNDFSLLCNYGNLKRDINENTEAIKYYKMAYKIDDKNETLLINLAGAYQISGEFDFAKKILIELHEKFPRCTKGDFMFSSIHTYIDEDKHREQMLKKLSFNDLAPQDIVYLYFAISKSYSDIKDYKNSSHYLIKANKKQFSLFKSYNFENELKKFDSIKEQFNNFNYIKPLKVEKPNLIFIVGMPRSGTTLTHQIVSSHSKIYGAGEVPILINIFQKKINDINFLNNFFEDTDYQNNKHVNELANKIEKLYKTYDDKIVLDKSPLNFMWIGFIKIMFPNAKIIHCKRNLKDVALSIYKNYFDGGSLPWSFDEECLIKFIKAYSDLMDFWYQKFPDEIYTCEYENLVNNQLRETKKIIAYCNLNWEEQCIDHTKNSTGIKTVSISQARKPIYKSSVNLSENYFKYLDFLRKV